MVAGCEPVGNLLLMLPTFSVSLQKFASLEILFEAVLYEANSRCTVHSLFITDMRKFFVKIVF